MSTEATVVAVTKHGQATIPKRLREKLGIDAPGKVQFRETEDGNVIVERVPAPDEMRGFAKRHGNARSDRPATEILHGKRDAERRHRSDQFDREDE